MSSKARSVEHGGVIWKVIPGSRREQLLMRFIRQDNSLHHADIAVTDVVGVNDWAQTGWFWVGVIVGCVGTGGAWWLL